MRLKNKIAWVTGAGSGLGRAAAVMGAGPVRIFLRVTLPLSLPGLVAGCFLTFILSLGFFIGRLKFGPVSLGTVASTLIVGVLIGLANVKVDPFTKSVFFYLFIFAIGYKVGPQFFQGLRGEGLRQAALAVVFCLVALGTVWAISAALGFDKGLAAGLLAGSLTSSGTIGSASDAKQRHRANVARRRQPVAKAAWT